MFANWFNIDLAKKIVSLYDGNLLKGVEIKNLATDSYGYSKDNVIYINFNKIFSQFKDKKKILMEIAATIFHECCHKTDRQKTGRTNEWEVKAKEKAFLAWVERNWETMIKGLHDY